jgi:hypothetical protein
LTTDRTSLPGYAQEYAKRVLLDSGASGTVYALTVPESHKAIQDVVDGAAAASGFDGSGDRQEWLSAFEEAWTSKQDAEHETFFDVWTAWSRPVVSFDREAFPNRYPTAGASEAIFKLMSAECAKAAHDGRQAFVHVFEGEYEGFRQYATAHGMEVRTHPRSEWRDLTIDPSEAGQFWISQPSAIDGMVWDDFDAFCANMAKSSPSIEIVPDLSYVGAVARDYAFCVDHPNVDSFVVSCSKPFGGYYHRCGGAFSRTEKKGLFANVWFKNLTSLRWGVRMLRTNGVFDLPRRYREAQETAAETIGRRLAIDGLRAADVMVMAVAPVREDLGPVIGTLVRGCDKEALVRICVTPTMASIVAPHQAPTMTRHLLSKYGKVA